MPIRRLYALTFVGGAASLGGEIAAARLMAPWFGDSTLIWANTIGIVLVALSIGYWLGGKFADDASDHRPLAYIVLGASIVFAILPFVARPFLRVSVDALSSVSAGAFVGSLIAVLVLLAVPMILLGMISPFVVKLAIRSVEEAGRVTGRLYAVSTLGSLAGTFLSSLLLIPFVGTRRTFLVYAFALAMVAAWSLGRRFAIAPIVMAILLALPVGTIKAVGDGRVIWEKETLYQYAVVIERDDGQRRLELNEGQAVHSVYDPGRWLTGNYWDEFLVLPFAADPDGYRPLRSVAILGNAAGTVARQYGHYFPDTRVDGVEIDGELNDLAVELFDLNRRDAPNVHLHTADGRPWLRAQERRYDAIFVDAYRQPYVPFHFATKEFFEQVRDRLNPGGVVLVNIGHPESSNALEEVLTATMADVFSTVVRDPSQDVNTIAMAGDGSISAENLRGAIPGLPVELRPIAEQTAARLAPRLPGGKVYTDDISPVEWLIDASIVEVAASGER